MLRADLRMWPLSSFLGILDLKTGVTIAILFAVLNKVAGVYGLIATLTGAGGSFSQLSMYIYSVLALVAFGWGLQVVKAEDARQTLYFAHLFSADYVLSTAWTAYFAAVWWWHTPHDGARQANSQAQKDLIAVAKLAGPPLLDAQRVDAARAIWAREQGTAFAVILLSWFSKIYLALLIYSYAMHLRKGTYRALARTIPPQRPGVSAPADGAVLPEDEDEDVEDFYRVPLRTPPPPNPNAHLRTASLSSFADFVGDTQKRAPRPAPSKAPEEDEDELLFDDDYQYASSGTTSKATSKRGTESSSTDNEDDAGERATFVPSWTSRLDRSQKM
ncbi:Inositolphosphorylceramide synthase subunit Kei1-domain-containing protein [Mycena pura]|uniref:Inositolphosphorylceramide synthase subunit Kei1-domain-containing protein n=1 Tax=Mycena pura TaxID=153505 RepID=A0AAD7E0G8_9AGAR|nr:Inositolphosphorylceramide synthase subunit Kei1-domain-containing protein [Mycena pura]